jgi:hypothetical protein
MFSYEASELLMHLTTSPAWSVEILEVIQRSINDLIDGLHEGRVQYDCALGALGFLGLQSKTHSDLDNYYQEWSTVEVQDAAIAQGHIIKIKEEKNSVKLFSVDDETVYTESLDKIV